MAALGALAFVEHIAPYGEITRRVMGFAFLIEAMARITNH